MTDAAAPNLRTVVKVVPANSSLQVDNVGSFATLLKTTGNAGDITISFGPGQANRFDNGDKYQTKDHKQFPYITLFNGSGANVTVTLGIGDGDIVVSNAATITNTVTVIDVAAEASLAQIHADCGTTLHADLTQLHTDMGTNHTDMTQLHTDIGTTLHNDMATTLHADIVAIVTQLKDNKLNRAGMTDLTSATFGTATNTTNTLVTAGANVNGVIIRSVSWCQQSTSVFGGPVINGNRMMPASTFAGSQGEGIIQNIFVPAGWSVAITSNQAALEVDCWYQVL